MLSGSNPVDPVRSDTLGNHWTASEVPCVVSRATATNTSGGALYLHLFDAAALPDDGAVPLTSPITIAAGSNNGNDWRPNGIRCQVGCVLALSSTLDTLTLAGPGVGRFFVEKV